ncbi:hypothetical protein PR202_gb00659 [Eleusine coracana subsp. coracana]|uniref:DUF4220 domain-containing protein n=1 Tax=Eleusine coracana subsp. coracana TaxID=191504 RepID=A0AAV5DSF1_ELECO|nr:hypothetical protein PR202_gb00659 [Eleusine coracana subsp. coracana]
MIVAKLSQFWSKWGFQIYVIFSLGANVVLGLLSRTRCRLASSRCARRWQKVLVFIVWVLYQLGEAATTSAISGLTLCGSDVSEDEKQVVALWAPFLLLHLGGPDNLTAYALEDNKLEKRAWFEMTVHFIGVGYAIFQYTYRDDRSWVMIAASVIIFVAGVTKHVERTYARWKANFDKMQKDASSPSSSSSSSSLLDDSSSNNNSNKETAPSGSTEARMDRLKDIIDSKTRRWVLCDLEALLLAQDLHPIWRQAMVDYSVQPESSRQQASQKVHSLTWRSVCKVAEMELSLMYEVLYTKAMVAQSWLGWYYLVRFLSPVFTAAAALLFWIHRQQQQQQVRVSFVRITYALLLIDFLLDLAWLLRALGSTWAYAYAREHAPGWLHHQVICPPRRWCRLHRFVNRIDPTWWLLRRDPVSYRTWSGTIGRYNLLSECTTTSCCSLWWPEWLKPKEETRQHRGPGHLSEKYYIMEDIRSKWGLKAFDVRDREQLFPGLDDIHDEDEAPRFGTEFEEDVLAWHIATCIILPYIRSSENDHATAIEVMSEYMMFLVAFRREMLPGLVLHSLWKVTRETLVSIWGEHLDYRKQPDLAALSNKEKLAIILRRMRVKDAKKVAEEAEKGRHKKIMKPSEGTTLIWDAINLFASLTLAADTVDHREQRKNSIESGDRLKRRKSVPVAQLLDLIFNVWVDKLVYAALRCSRESHAKQLSAGGDLTTVLWMVIQHAAPFRMGPQKGWGCSAGRAGPDGGGAPSTAAI